MNILQITPGAGRMYCGGCFHDNALVAGLRELGHTVTLMPLYLPMTLDEEDQGQGMPIFFGGVSVYLAQKLGPYRHARDWMRRALAHPRLLDWSARVAGRTQPAALGELTVSMLRGEEGRQRGETDEMLRWLRTQPRPDVVCLSNALLLGLAPRLRAELGAPVVCQLQGEDSFLDRLPEPWRREAWAWVARQAQAAAAFVAPSRYYAGVMQPRLGVPGARVAVVYNGIQLEGYAEASAAERPGMVLGFFARMCADKGLDLLVEVYRKLKARPALQGLKLRVGGGCGPADEPFVRRLQADLRQAGLLGEVAFCPNLTRAEKVAFYRSLTVLSVPALYGEAFGLYGIEAMAAGVPVVQPRHGAFPELIEATGGGVIAEPDAASLADALESLLRDPSAVRRLGEAGRQSVRAQFSALAMARRTVALYERL